MGAEPDRQDVGVGADSLIAALMFLLAFTACTPAQEARIDAGLAHVARKCARLEAARPLVAPTMALVPVPPAEVAKGDAAVAAWCAAIKAVAVPVDPPKPGP